MAIKSSTFGRVELSGKDAARFIRHMDEDKPNQFAIAALARARKIRDKIRNEEKFSFTTPNGA